MDDVAQMRTGVAEIAGPGPVQCSLAVADRGRDVVGLDTSPAKLFDRAITLRADGPHEGIGATGPFGRRDAHPESLGAYLELRDGRPRIGKTGTKLGDLCGQRGHGATGRWRGIQPGERDRVDPGLPGAPVARPLRTRRRTLAGESILRVQAEQAIEPGDPGRVVIDGDRRPGVRLTRSHGHAVAASVVDERDRRDLAGRPGRTADGSALALPERRRPEAPDGGCSRTDPGRQAQRNGLEILARLYVCGVGPGPREDDGVVVLPAQEGVVPASAQVRAHLVMCGSGEPDRGCGSVVALLQEDEALLPVGLVVVRPRERRAPVVHRVEEQVVADGPARVAHDAAVVHEARIARPDRGALVLGGRNGAARDRPTNEERQVESRVDHPGHDADPGKPARSAERGPVACGRPGPIGSRPPAPGRSGGRAHGPAGETAKPAGHRSSTRRRERRPCARRPGRPPTGRTPRRSRPPPSGRSTRPGCSG